MHSVLASYVAGDQERSTLRESEVLRTAAEQVVAELGDGPVHLIARTDEALMVAAAAAVQRALRTTVGRAPVGRSGWEPASGAVLLEVGVISDGLRRTLSSRYPGLRWLEIRVPRPALSEAA